MSWDTVTSYTDQTASPSTAWGSVLSYQPRSLSSVLASPAPVTGDFGTHRPGLEVFSPNQTSTDTNFGVPMGTPVQAPKGHWQVEHTYSTASPVGGPRNGENNGYGNEILLKNTQTGEQIRLQHLKDVMTHPGDIVVGGMQLGTSGDSGNSTGPNVGAELIDKNEKYQDIMKSEYAPDVATGSGGQGGGGSFRKALPSEIVERTLKAKGDARRFRLLADFPEAKHPETMTRKEQDQFLRAATKRRYH